MSNFTQPLCCRCWNIRHPDKQVERERDGHGPVERCCDCGWSTASGIYIRVDPKTVTYPSE